MPIEKTANFIRIRIVNPKSFIRFRVKTLGKAIKAVIGFKKGGGSQIQSLLFSRKKWTLKTAKAWVKAHNYTVSESFWVTDISIDPETMELVLEETVANDEDESEDIDKISSSEEDFIKNMTEEDIKWLFK